jgi:hypothetical protein
MKVKNCTKVFSFTEATAMKARVMVIQDLSSSSEFYLKQKASDIAGLFLFFDQFFDSCNSNLTSPLPGKGLQLWGKKSQHVSLWRDSISILKTMFFVDENNPSKSILLPSQIGFLLSKAFYTFGKNLKNKTQILAYQIFKSRSS